MNPEKQRIAIAEACGLIITNYEAMTPSQRKVWEDDVVKILPDYLTDLNAMHEVEKNLSREGTPGSASEWLEYDRQLKAVTEAGAGRNNYYTSRLWRATAAQRAEAFLRTVGKWEPS